MIFPTWGLNGSGRVTAVFFIVIDGSLGSLKDLSSIL